jgi:hypothetical protein
VNAPEFRVGENVDLWMPNVAKHSQSFVEAKVVRAEHPTYWVGRGDDDDNLVRVSVRRLRKIPEDPFTGQFVAPQHGEEPAGEQDVEESFDDSDDHQTEHQSDIFDPASASLLEQVREEGTLFLYQDGGRVYAGRSISLEGETMVLQDVVLQKKGALRAKPLRTFVGPDGVLVYANYRPKNSEPVEYRLPSEQVYRIIKLQKGHVLISECPPETVFV